MDLAPQTVFQALVSQLPLVHLEEVHHTLVFVLMILPTFNVVPKIVEVVGFVDSLLLALQATLLQVSLL